jgi:predicted HTH transcriptional regulator
MAVFANSQGGVIIFGVSDKPRLVVGANPADFMDEAEITTRLRQDFSPELPFESKTYEVGALTLLAFCVEPAVDRPVICQRDEVAFQEAAIYYRYSAQTTPIAYTELRALLDEREERRLRIIMRYELLPVRWSGLGTGRLAWSTRQASVTQPRPPICTSPRRPPSP